MDKRWFRDEGGAMQLVEAVIIYPVVFLLIFVLIYLGLFILQSVTLGVYAQKIAMVASREVSSPGYHAMLSEDLFNTAAVELDLSSSQDPSKPYSGAVNIGNNTKQARAYRYWSSSPMSADESEFYEKVLETLVNENSILVPASSGKVEAKVTCSNNVFSQLVTVEVSQELAHFSVLDFFGIESPTVSASAVATVSDTDELVRNTDFAVDAVTALAERMGVDTKKIKETVNKAISALGLNNG